MIMANTISGRQPFQTVIRICGMNTLGSRIAHFRKIAGLSQASLAKACGWGSQSRVGNYEKNTREPSLDDIAVMAKALGISSEELLFTSDNSNVAPTLQPYKEAKEYPLISWVVAGVWEESCDNFNPGDADEWLDSNANAGPHGYWLEVRGLSMVAPNDTVSFPPKMRILVQPEGFDLSSGKFYIAKMMDTGETTFKQYIRDAGVEYLQPLNPSFKTIEITENVRIIGRVVDAKLPKSLF